MRRRVMDHEVVDPNVLLLLDANKGLVDQSDKCIITNSGISIVNDSVFGKAFSLSGGSYADFTFPVDFGAASDFTIEFWAKTASSFYNHSFLVATKTTSWNSMCFGVITAHKDRNNNAVVCSGNYGSGVAIDSSTNIIGSWHHVAVQRLKGLTTMYIYGVLKAQSGSSFHVSLKAYGGLIGTEFWDGMSGRPYFSGLFANLKISDIARYASNFTPPTKPY